MKRESDDSGIIVYEIRESYSAGTSRKSNNKTDATEKKGAFTPDQKQVDAESMAQLGGFSGRVYDKLTHRTIEGVLVTIAKDLSVKTDEKGIFSVVGIKPGKYRITAFEDGYVAHSCKVSAIAGEMIKLDSFHLVPDCLAAQYPESTTQEEEGTVEGEVVEFAMESPQVKSSEEITCSPEAGNTEQDKSETKETWPEELPEKTVKMSSDDANVGDNRRETVPDLHFLKTITEDETVEHSETVVPERDFSTPLKTVEETVNQPLYSAPIEEIPSIEMEPSKDLIATPEEKVDAVEQLSVTEISLGPVDTTIAEAVQPEEGSKKIMEVDSEEVPPELPVGEIPVETTAEDSVEAESREAPIEAFLEEIQTPMIDQDSTESAASVPEEIIIEKLPSPYVKTTIVEAMHPEETLEKIQEEIPETAQQEPLVKKSRLRHLWGILRGKEPDEIDQEQLSGPSAGETIEQSLPLPEHREQPVESSVETIPHDDVIEETRLEEPSVETFFVNIQAPMIDQDSREAVMYVPKEKIIEEESFVEEILLSPVEITNVEAKQPEGVPWSAPSIEEAPIETIMEDTALDDFKEEAYQEQCLSPFAEISVEQAVPLPEYLATPLEPFLDSPPEIALQGELLEKIHEEEQPIETPLEDIPIPGIASYLTEVVIPIPEELIIGEGLCVEELSLISVESTHKEQSIEPSTEVISQTALQTDVLEEAYEEEVSLSDEERAALSSEENVIEAGGFAGNLNAQPNPAFRGLLITIAYHLRNVACDDPHDFIIRITVVNPDTGTIHETFEVPVTCMKDTFSIGGFTFSTASYEAYVYTLSMEIISKKTKTTHVLDSIPLEIKNLF